MHWRHVCLLFGLLALLGSLGHGSRVEAQGAGNFEKVRFTSVDGVDLYGAFHQANRKTAPTVLMLHGLKDDDSNKKAWINLADTLQKNGFSVLRFDFRGHGQSKDVDPDLFWRFKHNALLVKGAPKKATIEFKDMQQAYYPCLVNDIMAAKAFLDFRHDAGLCNTQSLFVLGADAGATLGALWLNAEWHRHRFEPPMMFQPGQIIKRPEGKDVIGCVWLSMTSKLGQRALPLSKLLDLPGKQGATPMVFFYSNDDMSGKLIAKALEKTLKGTKKDEKELYRYTAAVEVKAGKLSGASLLQKSLGTEDAIVEYVKSVAEAKAVDWVERDFRRNEYVWVLGGGQPLQAKSKTEKSFVFDSFERFLPK